MILSCKPQVLKGRKNLGLRLFFFFLSYPLPNLDNLQLLFLLEKTEEKLSSLHTNLLLFHLGCYPLPQSISNKTPPAILKVQITSLLTKVHSISKLIILEFSSNYVQSSHSKSSCHVPGNVHVSKASSSNSSPPTF